MQDKDMREISMREVRENPQLNVRIDDTIGSPSTDQAESSEYCEVDIAGHKIAHEAREVQGGCPLCGLTHNEDRWVGRDNDPAFEDHEQINARIEHLQASLDKLDRGEYGMDWLSQNRLQFCPRCIELTGTSAELTTSDDVAKAIRLEIAALQERAGSRSSNS